jgi:S1-C subfamily serine protease
MAAMHGRLLLFALFLLTIFAPVDSDAQVLDKSVLNSTVWVTYEAPAAVGSSATASQQLSEFGGTGFLLFKGVGYTKGQVYLVTNKHVLPPEGKQQDIKVRVAVRDKDGNTKVDSVRVPIVAADGKYLDSVRVHPDNDTDVAAVNIAPAAFGQKFQLLIDAITTRKYLDVSMLMTSERLKRTDIGVGSQIYVVGYPAAIFDPRNVSPILRTGIISTDPRDGFNFNEQLRRAIAFPEHVDGFLIDSAVYPGSSGSLVVLGPDFSKLATNPALKDSPPVILGIVAGSIPYFDASIRSYERIGLGIVYSADTVKAVLDSFDRPLRRPQ